MSLLERLKKHRSLPTITIEPLPELKPSYYQILGTGTHFFDDLRSEIDRSQKYVIIKIFQWRNDEAGRLIAKALIRAAERGVQILIIKDRIGGFFEYSEGNGQSFFHDRPFKDSFFRVHGLYSLYPQAKILAKCVGGTSARVQCNYLKYELLSHSNVHVLDQYKLYDHSKVFIVDGKTAYVGGIGLCNEFYIENDSRWVDHVIKITGETDTHHLLLALSSIPYNFDRIDGGAIKFVTHNSLKSTAHRSIHQFTLDFVAKTKKELWIEMAFLGHIDYVYKLSELLEKGVKINIITSSKPSLNRHRNNLFFRRIQNMTDHNPNFRVYHHPRMVHSKIFIRDNQTLFMGSHNMSMDELVMEETNFLIDDPIVIKKAKHRLLKHANESKKVNHFSWISSYLFSGFDYFGAYLQTIGHFKRSKDIAYARAHVQIAINDIIHTFW